MSYVTITPKPVRPLADRIIAHDPNRDMTMEDMVRMFLHLDPSKIENRHPDAERQCMLYLASQRSVKENLREFVEKDPKHFPRRMRIFFLYRFQTFVRMAGVSTLKEGIVQIEEDFHYKGKLLLPAKTCRLLSLKD